MPDFVRLDMFPAEVLVEGVRYSPSRVIVTGDTLHVYVDAPGGPVEAYTTRLEDFSGRKTTGYTVLNDEGAEVRISRAGGCGCGSRLRGFNPFSSIPHIPSP